MNRADFEQAPCQAESAHLCGCGCGRPTKVSDQTNLKRGWIRGQPRHFLRGHSARRMEARRYQVRDGIRVHVARAEKSLGRPLPLGAVVHHADGSTSPTAPLVICQDGGYHSFLHARMRVVRAGGNPNTEKVCSACKAVKPLTDFNSDKSKYAGVATQCRACQRDAVLAAALKRNQLCACGCGSTVTGAGLYVSASCRVKAQHRSFSPEYKKKRLEKLIAGRKAQAERARAVK